MNLKWSVALPTFSEGVLKPFIALRFTRKIIARMMAIVEMWQLDIYIVRCVINVYSVSGVSSSSLFLSRST